MDMKSTCEAKPTRLTLALVICLLACAPSAAQTRLAHLRPSPDYWDIDDGPAPVRVRRVPGGRRLASVGDTLYMLDARGRVLWKWTSGGPPFTDEPVIDSTGTIYVIGYDLLWAAIDSADGKLKWAGTANGRALYSQIGLYRDDMYYVVTDMRGYRDNTVPHPDDYLTLCKGNDILWETAIPAGARIRVWRGRLFAVYRRRGRLVSRELKVPRRFGRPVGKVSALAARAAHVKAKRVV